MRGLLAVRVTRAPRALQSLTEPRRRRRAVRKPVEPDEHPAPAVGDQAHAPGLPGAPAHGISRGNVEVHAPCSPAVEDEAPVHLEERVVRTDENRVIRGVDDVDLLGGAARVEDDRGAREQDLAGPHRESPSGTVPAPIGRSTWSTRMPSPKRHSIFTVPISSATPSRTSSAPSALCPARTTSS